MPNLGLPELAIILVIVIMLFGVGKLPEVFGAVGKGIKEFRKETTDDLKKNVAASSAPAAPAAPSATTSDVVNDSVEKVV